jgi:hypothetical protein
MNIHLTFIDPSRSRSIETSGWPRKTLEGLAAHLFNLKTGEDTMRWLDECDIWDEMGFGMREIGGFKVPQKITVGIICKSKRNSIYIYIYTYIYIYIQLHLHMYIYIYTFLFSDIQYNYS